MCGQNYDHDECQCGNVHSTPSTPCDSRPQSADSCDSSESRGSSKHRSSQHRESSQHRGSCTKASSSRQAATRSNECVNHAKPYKEEKQPKEMLKRDRCDNCGKPRASCICGEADLDHDEDLCDQCGKTRGEKQHGVARSSLDKCNDCGKSMTKHETKGSSHKQDVCDRIGSRHEPSSQHRDSCENGSRHKTSSEHRDSCEHGSRHKSSSGHRDSCDKSGSKHRDYEKSGSQPRKSQHRDNCEKSASQYKPQPRDFHNKDCCRSSYQKKRDGVEDRKLENGHRCDKKHEKSTHHKSSHGQSDVCGKCGRLERKHADIGSKASKCEPPKASKCESPKASKCEPAATKEHVCGKADRKRDRKEAYGKRKDDAYEKPNEQDCEEEDFEAEDLCTTCRLEICGTVLSTRPSAESKSGSRTSCGSEHDRKTPARSGKHRSESCDSDHSAKHRSGSRSSDHKKRDRSASCDSVAHSVDSDKHRSSSRHADKHRSHSGHSDKHRSGHTDKHRSHSGHADEHCVDSRRTDKHRSSYADKHRSSSRHADKHCLESRHTDKHRSDSGNEDKHCLESRHEDKHQSRRERGSKSHPSSDLSPTGEFIVDENCPIHGKKSHTRGVEGSNHSVRSGKSGKDAACGAPVCASHQQPKPQVRFSDDTLDHPPRAGGSRHASMSPKRSKPKSRSRSRSRHSTCKPKCLQGQTPCPPSASKCRLDPQCSTRNFTESKLKFDLVFSNICETLGDEMYRIQKDACVTCCVPRYVTHGVSRSGTRCTNTSLEEAAPQESVCKKSEREGKTG